MIGPSHDCIVIPARGLAVGKSRLAATLTTSERERLNRQLLEHVLQVALSAFRFPDGCPRPGVGVVVVSPDPATLAFALERGGSPLLEPSALGLNAAIDWAARHVAVMGAARVLVLPADLPLLEVGDVHALLEGDPREALDAMGYGSTIDYLTAMCRAVLEETSLLPHVARLTVRWPLHAASPGAVCVDRALRAISIRPMT